MRHHGLSLAARVDVGIGALVGHGLIIGHDSLLSLLGHNWTFVGRHLDTLPLGRGGTEGSGSGVGSKNGD